MKLNSNIKINFLGEGMNLLRAWLSVLTGKMFSRPVSLNLLPTMNCNSRCIICDSWKIRETDVKLDLEIYRELAREMKKMGIPYVTIGGGEPLLFKDILALIRVLRDEEISVQLTTNGFEITNDNFKELLALGLSRLTFSIDSHIPHIYESMRGVDWSEKVLSTIDDCIKESKGRISIETNSVITNKNVDTFPETVKYFINKKVNKVCFSAVTIFSDNYLIQTSKENLSVIDNEKIKKLVEDLLLIKRNYPKKIAASSWFIKGLEKYFGNPLKAVYPCYAGFLTLDILYNGDVYSCGNLPKLGNIKNNSLGEIWYSKEASKSRKSMAGKKCPACYTSCKIELGLLGNPWIGIPYCIEKIKEAL